MRHFLLALFFIKCSLSYSQAYTSYFTGDTTDVAATSQFGLCLMGGATEEDHAMRWFLQKSGGGDIVVLRTTGTNGYNAYLYSQLGVSVNSVETILFKNASAAYDPYVLRRIAGAEAIWIAGGDQSTYRQFWRGTPVDTLLNHLSTIKKIPIGGTSAGMAILGWSFNSAATGSVTSAQALANPYSNLVTVEQNNFLKFPFMQKTITDTHFDNPDRRGRQIVFMSRMMAANGDTVRGIACDEYTAVCIDSTGIARVYGGAPTYDDNAYFLQVNNQLPNMPETLITGTALTWDRNHEAIKAYNIKGDTAGFKTFDLNTWCQGSGGTWQNWYVVNGVLSTAIGASPCNPLPLNFISFSAIERGKAISLEWKVAQQKNVMKYEVQRKNTFGVFKTIQTVQSIGNSSDIISYQFLDKQPFNGDNIYRIKSIDFSGDFKFSATVKISVKSASLHIAPNPAKDHIFIHFSGKNYAINAIKLINSMGETCYTASFPNDGITMFKMMNLPATMANGCYLLQLLSGNEVVAKEKLLVNR